MPQSRTIGFKSLLWALACLLPRAVSPELFTTLYCICLLENATPALGVLFDHCSRSGEPVSLRRLFGTQLPDLFHRTCQASLVDLFRGGCRLQGALPSIGFFGKKAGKNT